MGCRLSNRYDPIPATAGHRAATWQDRAVRADDLVGGEAQGHAALRGQEAVARAHEPLLDEHVTAGHDLGLAHAAAHFQGAAHLHREAVPDVAADHRGLVVLDVAGGEVHAAVDDEALADGEPAFLLLQESRNRGDDRVRVRGGGFGVEPQGQLDIGSVGCGRGLAVQVDSVHAQGGGDAAGQRLALLHRLHQVQVAEVHGAALVGGLVLERGIDDVFDARGRAGNGRMRRLGDLALGHRGLGLVPFPGERFGGRVGEGFGIELGLVPAAQDEVRVQRPGGILRRRMDGDVGPELVVRNADGDARGTAVLAVRR